MNKVISILLAAMGAMITSCTTLTTFPVDQMIPADVSFPAQIQNVAFVNNLPYPPYRWPKNQLIEGTYGAIEGDGTITVDSLAQYVANGNYFNQVLVCDSALREKDADRRFSPLKPEEVKKLSNDLGVDMIVSLDEIMIKVTPGFIFSFEDMETINVVNAEISTLARVYIPSRREPLVSLVDKDSIYWYSPVVQEKEVLENTSGFAGSMVVKHLIPSWRTVVRYYYSGGSSDFRDAEVSVKKGNWEEALATWGKVYRSDSKKKQKYAAFNMAVYYEMQDQFDEAEKWLGKAMEQVSDRSKMPGMESGEYQLMKEYLTEIGRRRDEVQKLNIQLDRFN